eukprot:3199151-Lingulodinium_polyedra.AAC.1
MARGEAFASGGSCKVDAALAQAGPRREGGQAAAQAHGAGHCPRSPRPRSRFCPPPLPSQATPGPARDRP